MIVIGGGVFKTTLMARVVLENTTLRSFAPTVRLKCLAKHSDGVGLGIARLS